MRTISSVLSLMRKGRSFVLLLPFVALYGYYLRMWDVDAGEAILFCPIRRYLGFRCIGCGIQHALHYLLNGDVRSAFFSNPVLPSIMPVVLMICVFAKNPMPRIIGMALVAVCATVARNIIGV